MTSDQRGRLQQIGLQVLGAKALSKPEIAKTLGITPDQKKRLAAIQQVASQEVCTLMAQKNPDASQDHYQPGDTISQKISEIHKKAEQQILDEVLNANQKAKLQELYGEKLDLAKYYDGSATPGGSTPLNSYSYRADDSK